MGACNIVTMCSIGKSAFRFLKIVDSDSFVEKHLVIISGIDLGNYLRLMQSPYCIITRQFCNCHVLIVGNSI